MKTILQSTSKTLTASTSRATREKEGSPLTCHVTLTKHLSRQTKQYEPHATDSEMKQVELLFPEFFTRCSDTTLAKRYKIKTSVNLELNQRLEEPLIQSWLHLYGGSLHD